MKDQFNLYHYDKYMALKVSFLLWLIILWSMHHTLLITLSAFSRSGYVFHVASEYAGNAPLLISNLPAILLLLIALNRTPQSGKFVRLVWRHGKKLLLATIICGAILTVSYHEKKITNPGHLYFWALLLDTGATSYLLFSRRISDIFADFPAPAETSEASAKKPHKQTNNS